MVLVCLCIHTRLDLSIVFHKIKILFSTISYWSYSHYIIVATINVVALIIGLPEYQKKLAI